MTDSIADLQREAVLTFFAGAHDADADKQLSVMDGDAEYWSIDANFNRHTYRGKLEIGRFLNTFYKAANSVSYEVRSLAVATDLVSVEWADSASIANGPNYENQGVMIFRFVPGTAYISALRSYFDWKPLLDHASWREEMSKS